MAPHNDEAVGENADVENWSMNVGGLVKLFGRADVDEFDEPKECGDMQERGKSADSTMHRVQWLLEPDAEQL